MAIAGAVNNVAEAKINDAVAVFDAIAAVIVSATNEDSVTFAVSLDLQGIVPTCSVPIRSELSDRRTLFYIDHGVRGMEIPPFRSGAGLGSVSVGLGNTVPLGLHDVASSGARALKDFALSRSAPDRSELRPVRTRMSVPDLGDRDFWMIRLVSGSVRAGVGKPSGRPGMPRLQISSIPLPPTPPFMR